MVTILGDCMLLVSVWILHPVSALPVLSISSAAGEAFQRPGLVRDLDRRQVIPGR